MAQGIFYDGSTDNLIITASRVDISGSLSIQGISNVSSSIASGGGGGGGSQNLQQVLDTGNTATQDIDLTGYVDADEYKLFGNTIITGSGQVNNVSIGDGVGIGGNKLVAIGKDAFQSGGNDLNTVIGFKAGRSVNTVNGLTAVGGQAAEFHTGSQSVIIGETAGQYSNSSVALMIGVDAGQNISDSNVVLLGFQAGQNLYSGSAEGTLAIGFKAGQFSSGSNTLIGANSGRLNQGNDNVFIGFSGEENTGDTNVGIGYNALRGSSGANNTAFGQNTLGANTGDGNFAVGGAGQNNTGDNNILFDTEAGNSNSGNRNVFISYRSGQNNSGLRNIGIGSQTLDNNSSNDNVAIGTNALRGSIAGPNNIAIGNNAGYEGSGLTSTNGRNTFIGFNASYGTKANIRQAVAIGANATVEKDFAIVLGSTAATVKVGIGLTSPNARLHVKSGYTTSNQIAFLVEDTNGTDLFKVTSDGRVGIPISITPTGTSDSQGSQGDISYDNDYFYVKTSAGWKRAALSTF